MRFGKNISDGIPVTIPKPSQVFGDSIVGGGFSGPLTEKLTDGALSDITLGDAVKIASLSAANPSVVTFELGSDLFTGWDFTSGFGMAGAGTTIDDSDSFTVAAANGGVTKLSFLTVGKRYKIIIGGSTSASSIRIQSPVAPFPIYGDGFGTHYFTAEGSAHLYIRTTTGTTDITILEIYEYAGTLSEGDGIQIAGLSDAEMLDPSLITGTDSDMSGANNWANLGLNAMDVNSTVAGKLYMESSVAGGFALIADALAGVTGYVKLKLKARLKAGVSTPLNIGLADGFDIICSFPITPTGSELEYEGVCKIDEGTTVFIQIDTTTAGIQFEIDDFTAEPYSIINGEVFELTNFSTTAPTAEIDVDLSNKSGATGECFARLAEFTNWTAGDGIIPYVEVNPESLITNGGMEFDRDWADEGLEVGDTQARSLTQAWKGTYSRKIDVDANFEGAKSALFAVDLGDLYFIAANIYNVSGSGMLVDVNQRLDFSALSDPSIIDEWQIVSQIVESQGTGNERIKIISKLPATEAYFDEVQVYNIVAFGARWTGSQSAESSLEQNVSALINRKYKLTTNTLDISASNITPEIGGTDGTAISTDITGDTQNLTSSGSGNYKLTATSTFEGKVIATIKCEKYN